MNFYNVLKILAYILSLTLASISLYAGSSSMIIEVEAGEPTVLCYGETLQLADLGASISGDVSDGLWFGGDGVFLPGGTSTGIFSTTLQYQPGLQDQANGSFTLILVSDDPDGNGPMVEVSDQVTITFMSAPPLACNNSINVSLAAGCEQEVDVTMLLANPVAPFDKYDIVLYDEEGAIIEGDLLTVDHIGTDITFQVTHECTSSSCGGNIIATDNIAPFLNCLQMEVDCEGGVGPESVGFPMPFYATATPTGPQSYLVSDFDDCGDVTLTYTDLEEELACASTGYIQRITRTWSATDMSDNTSLCDQIILVRPLPLADVVLPPHYDGNTNPVLSCSGSWIPLANGNPSPLSTGSPTFEACGNIATSYTDALFDECGAGFKVLRQWVIVDWCTTTTINHNQIIKVLDNEGPIFSCPEDLTIDAQPYECASVPHTLTLDSAIEDCSSVSISYQILTLDGTNISLDYLTVDLIEDLPVGSYELLYVVTDECGNSSSCGTALEVIDRAVPFAVCEGFTRVALGSNGMADLYATSVDDGSFDNCGDITMEVAKMNDLCGWGLAFGPSVRFCCEEVGDTMMVAFRVTDSQGLTNTCMVTVYVEDMLPPVIACPSDLTISCTFDFDQDDLSVFGEVIAGTVANDLHLDGLVVGSHGFYYDNCTATVSEVSAIDVDCGTGSIMRTFTAMDAYGETASCTQMVTIVNDAPFLQQDITWPINFVMEGCDTIQATPEITGEPQFSGEKCAMVASTYEDQVFYISGGACIKILRSWTVIDWCQYDPASGVGLWTYLQEIKLKNDIAPTFLQCEDREVCTYDDMCTSGEVTFAAMANDDCTDSLQMQYLWQLDIDDDGSMDESGEGISFTRDLVIGRHRVYWTVEDRCGNTAQCDYAVTLRDCKNPTPYCNSSITTTIMPSSGAIDIWASDFDYGSTDNCTAPEDLIFSFSPDISDTQRIITCDSIENGVAQAFTYHLYVTDEAGNQERCTVTFIVQDNADGCEDGTIKGSIKGSVKTIHDRSIGDAEIDITASIDTFSGFGMTDDEGRFTYGETPELLKYVLRPHYNSSARAGVNTLDLVMIQRHILGITPFDNPYDIIASDVSRNDRVNSSDLLTMRKLILGIITEWPREIDNWTFVDSSFVFDDVEHPFWYPDSIVIDRLMDTTRASNFIAIKMGDVNGSYSGLLEHGDGAESRSTAIALAKATSVMGDVVSTAFSFDTYSDGVDGLQMSLSVPDDMELVSDYLSEGDYTISDGVLKIAWVNADYQRPFLDVLFEITSAKQHDYQLTSDLEAEVYIDMQSQDVVIYESEIHGSDDGDDYMIEVLGNPFANHLHLVNNAPRAVSVEIVDVNGQLVYQTDPSVWQHHVVPDHHFAYAGIYFVRYRIDDGDVKTMKVVKTQ